MQRQLKVIETPPLDEYDAGVGPQDTSLLSESFRHQPARPQHERSSSLARIQRHFLAVRSRSSERGGTEAESQEEKRGPLGLTLLSEPPEPRVEFIFVGLLSSQPTSSVGIFVLTLSTIGSWFRRRVKENMEQLSGPSFVLAQGVAAIRAWLQTCPHPHLWL
jgi:hypothetical protein